ncbi:hypothetical protein FRC07_008214 [Ceratobasidium sp. 392]|nr:hypothetical protein FRC07_008214 [Ceratobasidium sp. 392]
MLQRPTIDISFERRIDPQDIHGFPVGNFLIRSHHSRYYFNDGRRLLQVAHNDKKQAAEIMAWVDESKGELKQANTKNFELVFQPPRERQSEAQAQRACQFFYDGASKAITVWVPTADDTNLEKHSDTDSAISISSYRSENSLSELIRSNFVLELVPQRQHSTVVRLWNHYTGSKEEEEQRQQCTEVQATAELGDAVDSSWHRGREIRVVARRDKSGCISPVTVFQQWDIIPLLK